MRDSLCTWSSAHSSQKRASDSLDVKGVEVSQPPEVDAEHGVPLVEQCELLTLNHLFSSLYLRISRQITHFADPIVPLPSSP